MPYIKQKMIERLNEAIQYAMAMNNDPKIVFYSADVADNLIANGVTVQDGKPLEAFLHPIDAYKGLKEKYLVFKAETGEKVDNCFVLRPDRDPAATEALRVYASSTDNENLAKDIYNWVGKGEPVQKWIPVTERLPEENERVLACYINPLRKDRPPRMMVGEGTSTQIVKGKVYLWCGGWRSITHWMPLPASPEEVQK